MIDSDEGAIAEWQRDLLNKHDEAQRGYADNTAYYESIRRPQAIGLATPPEMQKLLTHIGYPRLYVNALADRIVLEGFKLPGKEEVDDLLWEWWVANRLDVEFNLGCVEALVHGAAFITISAPPGTDNVPDDEGTIPGIPIIRVESPLALFADVDPWTRKVQRAIRVYRDEDGNVNRTVIYLPDRTIYRVKVNGDWTTQNTVQHNLGVVPVVPLLNRAKLSDFTGSSEITPELRSFTDAAGRLLMNMQAAAELMAIPQRVLFGADREDLIGPNGEPMTTLEAYMARILAIEAPDGKVDQFVAAELQNFANGMAEIRKEVASYTGLPPQYLSNASENPASADAIRSAERRLVLNAERKCIVFGGDLEEAMRVAWRVMNPGKELPKEYYRLQAQFRNPATPTYEAKADAASKLYANGTGVIPKERARIDIGYSPEERQQMKEWDKDEEAQADLMAMYASAAQPKGPPNEPEPVRGGASGDSSRRPRSDE